VLFTLAGDVETKLGPGSTAAAASALPIVYQQVPTHERQQLVKHAQNAIQEVRRQQEMQQDSQQPVAAVNPFDLRAARQQNGGRAGFAPLPAAEAPWPPDQESSATGVDDNGSAPSSPVAQRPIRPSAATVVDVAVQRSPLETDKG
jgi:hypothetical protein